MSHPLRSVLVLAALLGCLAATSATAAVLAFVETQKDGSGPIDGLDSARTVALSPDGAHVYAASENDDAVTVFSRDSGTGALTFVEKQQDGVAGVDGLDGATFVSVSPDGAHVYVAGIADNSVAVFARNGTTGALTFVEQHKDGVGGVDGLNAATAVTLSPDGAHVYASSYFDKAVAVFSRNATTGALTFVEVKKNGVGGVNGLDGANSVVVSPDGAHVYVAALADNSIVVFSRNVTTGALTFVQRKTTGVGGIPSLTSADAVAISPDGAHVYVGSFVPGNAVTVFSRNVTTGVLTFVEAETDGVGGVDGLRGVGSVAVSADGAYVFAAGIVDDAVAVFSRAPATGALTFIDLKRDGRGGVDGLDGAASVTVSPDGAHVYASSVGDDAVAVFRVICAGVASGDPCDDGDPCTTDDRCLLGQCVDAAAPPLGCRAPTTPGKALVMLKDRSPDAKDSLVWKWVKGAATAKADFGDPLATDAYALCIYDGATLAMSATAPAGGTCADTKPCWTEKPKGFQYKDKDLTPGGLSQIVLKEGLVDGKASIQVKGSGPLLGLPTLSTLASPLRVRLTNLATAACWEAAYSFPPASKNDATQFKDKAD